MVDSDNLITNLHFSNDIIIDASMPPVIREGGKMWNKDGELQETVAVIPDRTYARMYSAILERLLNKMGPFGWFQTKWGPWLPNCWDFIGLKRPGREVNWERQPNCYLLRRFNPKGIGRLIGKVKRELALELGSIGF